MKHVKRLCIAIFFGIVMGAVICLTNKINGVDNWLVSGFRAGWFSMIGCWVGIAFGSSFTYREKNE